MDCRLLIRDKQSREGISSRKRQGISNIDKHKENQSRAMHTRYRPIRHINAHYGYDTCVYSLRSP